MRFVPIRFDAMVDPDSDDLLPQESLLRGPLAQVHWNTQGSGMELSDECVHALERIWLPHVAKVGAPVGVRPPLTQERDFSEVRRLARNSGFATRVRAKGRGTCAACGPGHSYGAANILEAAHIKAVKDSGPDVLGNALLLCPNHHALFDEGYWTVEKQTQRIVSSKQLHKDLQGTFNECLTVPWELDVRQLHWHRTTVFLDRARKPRAVR